MPKATDVNQFGANNLRITETEESVTVEFDPRVIVGEFKTGSSKVCSTGSYRALDISGARIMLHVMGPKMPKAESPANSETAKG